MHKVVPARAPNLALLISKTIEQNDSTKVYDLIPLLSTVSLDEYARYKAQLKAHFKRSVSFTDFEKAVQGARQNKISRVKAPRANNTNTEPDDFPEDAERLCSAPGSVELYYSNSVGYLVKTRKDWRILLGATVKFERYARGNDPDSPRAFIEAHVCYPGTDKLVCVLYLSRQRAKMLDCWANLEGQIIDLPGDERESLLAYKAVAAHATRQVLAGNLVNQNYVSSYGWHEHDGMWLNVRANGCIGATGLYYGNMAPLTISAPKNAPQKLPEQVDLQQVDGSAFFDLLRFWREDHFLHFPLALLGGCCSVMLPHVENAGVMSWQLEMFGRTQFNKTTVINAMLNTFYGVYRYDQATEITDTKVGDTGVGQVHKEARLRGVAYQDRDYKYKPGHPLYDKYMAMRLESLGKTRNKAGGGERGKRHGQGSEVRPDAGGFLIRTGESDPHEYSIAQCDDESTDAGAVTYKYYGDSSAHMTTRKRRSVSIFAQSSQLQALGILWTQWLASHEPEQILLQYEDFKQQAGLHIESRAIMGKYNQVHARQYNALADIYIGLKFFVTFLEQARQIQGAGDIAHHITALLDSFIDDRLLAAHQLTLNYQEHRGGATQKESLAKKIGDAIYSEVSTLKAHFKSTSDMMPKNDEMPEGYTAVPHAGYSEVIADDQQNYRTSGPRLGIITPHYLYLSTKDLMPMLQKRVKNCPSKLDCQKALSEIGALITEKDGEKTRYTTQLQRGGPRYLKIAAWLVYGDDEDQAPGTESEPEYETGTIDD